MDELELTCPHCGRINRIFAEGLRGTERIGCSHCREELRRIEQLKTPVQQNTERKAG